MCLCFVFREIDDQSSRSTSASTDKSSSRTPSGTSKDWCVVGEHYVCKEEMRGSDFEDCRNCVSEKEYRECIKNHWSNKSTDSSRNTSGKTDKSSSRSTSGTSNGCDTDPAERDEVDYVYGAGLERFVELCMAGGGDHWWNYRVHIDKDGEQRYVEIQNKDGVRRVDGTLWCVGADGYHHVQLFLQHDPEKPDWVKEDEWCKFHWCE